MAAADRVVIDLGTGDGRAVLARAKREPRALVIGLDASSHGMAVSSLRAARSPAKGGLANVVFVVAAAEAPPVDLYGTADELTIQFPWGSLLHGALALDDRAASGIVRLAASRGSVEIVLSIADRDRAAAGVPPLSVADADPLAERWRRHGLELIAVEPAAADDLRTSRSTWARRLLASGTPDRSAWRITLRKPPSHKA